MKALFVSNLVDAPGTSLEPPSRRTTSLEVMAAALLIWLSSTTATFAAAPDIVWRTNGHAGLVRSAAFSRDGLHLASGANDNFAKVWALSNRSLVVGVQTPAKVISVALSPTASLLVTGGDDGAMRGWSVPDGIRIWGGSPNHGIVWSVVISADGVLTAGAGNDGRLGVGYAANGQGSQAYNSHESDVFSVAFSPDRIWLASASEGGSAKIWRVPEARLLYTLVGESYYPPGGEPENENGIHPVFSVDFSPDGETWVTAGADGTARLYRVADGTRLRVLEGGGSADNFAQGTAAKFSADGKTLFTLDTAFQFTGAGGTIKFWRVSDGRLLATFEHTGARCLAVSPDGKYFAYGTSTADLVLARVPLWIEQVQQAGEELILRWQGGSGLYRVQRTDNAVTGPWTNVGDPTTATAATNTITGTVFYRVQSLARPDP